MIRFERVKELVMGENPNVSHMRLEKNPIKVQAIKRFAMIVAVLAMLLCVKTNVKAETPVPALTVDGTAVNIGAATTGTGSSGGSWGFTPASGSNAAKLTLTNYQGGGIDYQNAPSSLTIVLVGTNRITTIVSGVNGITYYSDSNYTLLIEGLGNLTINSSYFGIRYKDIVGPPYYDSNLIINANLTINSDDCCIISPGELIINGGIVNISCQEYEAILVNSVTIKGGNITAKSTSSMALRLMNEGSKFEINGGTLTAIGGKGGIFGGYGSLYFNEGSQVIANSGSTSGISGIMTWEGQIHFNGGEVLAQNISERRTDAISAKKDGTGKAFYFGDSQRTRELIFFEGIEGNQLKRVSALDITDGTESKQASVHIYPRLKCSVQSSQKNATISLINKTPTYGSGPAKLVKGIRGETISVSISCAKDKKLVKLYYYREGFPSEKVTIDASKKTFAMPSYDVVVGATIVDKVKVKKIALNKKTLTIRKGKTASLRATITPRNVDDKGLNWKSSNKKIATVSQNGVIKGKKYGTVTISVTSKDGSNKKASCKVSIGYDINYKLNGGKNHKFNPSCYHNKKIKLKAPVRVGYVFKGWYTDKQIKKEISVIQKGKTKNYTIYAKWKKVKVPATANITKIKNTTGRKIELLIKKIKNAKGFEITYATNRSFSENVKTATTTKTTKVLKNLKKRKTYYVKIRAYQLDSAKKKVYGRYSSVKKVEIKK